jgi:hypothetical protein
MYVGPGHVRRSIILIISGLSGITWSGFDNHYYLFTYEDTRDAFAIPHDIRILEEVSDSCLELSERSPGSGYKLIRFLRFTKSQQRERAQKTSLRVRCTTSRTRSGRPGRWRSSWASCPRTSATRCEGASRRSRSSMPGCPRRIRLPKGTRGYRWRSHERPAA